ncbi:MAG: hypothetical protein D6698_08545 [Gammaproteobacteria bacterium]|nr:MAG: hypothetical protein D6698_08545 [Gammaproteobacteria bacterium]
MTPGSLTIPWGINFNNRLRRSLMAYSFVQYNGDGSTTSFAYGSIELFDNSEITHASQLKVYVDGVLKTVTTDYTVDTTNEEIDFVSAPASGTLIKIERDTQIASRYVDYTNNSIIEESVLDLDSNQLFFLIQELNDGLTNALTLDSDNYWNGQGYASRNCLPADTGSGWVTLQQMQDAIAGVDTATVDNATQWSFTGNGVLTDFTLTGLGLNIVAAQVWVWQNGVIQKPVTDYDIDNSGDDPVVQFVTAPASGDTIEIRSIHGTVTAIFDEVDGSIITDETIDPATKLKTSSGDNTRFIIIGSSGRVSTIAQLTHGHIQDFDSAVTGKSLDEFDDAAANISMGGNKITNLSSGASGSSDACTVAQMESHVSSSVGRQTKAGSMGVVGSGGFTTSSLGFQPSVITLIRKNSTGNYENASASFFGDHSGPVSALGESVEVQFFSNGFGFTPTNTGNTWYYVCYE